MFAVARIYAAHGGCISHRLITLGAQRSKTLGIRNRLLRRLGLLLHGSELPRLLRSLRCIILHLGTMLHLRPLGLGLLCLLRILLLCLALGAAVGLIITLLYIAAHFRGFGKPLRIWIGDNLHRGGRNEINARGGNPVERTAQRVYRTAEEIHAALAFAFAGDELHAQEHGSAGLDEIDDIANLIVTMQEKNILHMIVNRGLRTLLRSGERNHISGRCVLRIAGLYALLHLLLRIGPGCLLGRLRLLHLRSALLNGSKTADLLNLLVYGSITSALLHLLLSGSKLARLLHLLLSLLLHSFPITLADVHGTSAIIIIAVSAERIVIHRIFRCSLRLTLLFGVNSALPYRGGILGGLNLLRAFAGNNPVAEFPQHTFCFVHNTQTKYPLKQHPIC